MRTINWKRTMQCLLMGIVVLMFIMPIRICAETTVTNTNTEAVSESGTTRIDETTTITTSAGSGEGADSRNTTTPGFCWIVVIVPVVVVSVSVVIFLLIKRSVEKKGSNSFDHFYFSLTAIASVMIVLMAVFMVSVLVSAQIETKSTDQNITSFVGIVLTIVAVSVGLPAIFTMFEKKEMEDQKKEIGEQKKEIEEQKKEIGEQKKEIEGQKKEIGEQKKEIGKQKKEIEEQKKEIGEQKKEIGEQKKEIGKQKKEIEEQRNIVDNLEIKSNSLYGELASYFSTDSEEPHLRLFALRRKVKEGLGSGIVNEAAFMMLIGLLERDSRFYTNRDKRENEEEIIQSVCQYREQINKFEESNKIRLNISLAHAYYRYALNVKEENVKKKYEEENVEEIIVKLRIEYYIEAIKIWGTLLDGITPIQGEEKEKAFFTSYYFGQRALCYMRLYETLERNKQEGYNKLDVELKESLRVLINHKEENVSEILTKTLKETIDDFEEALQAAGCSLKKDESTGNYNWHNFDWSEYVLDDTIVNSFAAALQKKARIEKDFIKRKETLEGVKILYDNARKLFPHKQRPWSNIGATTRDIFYAILEVEDARNITPAALLRERTLSVGCEEIKKLYNEAVLSLSQAKELDPSFIDSYLVSVELEYQMIIFNRLVDVGADPEQCLETAKNSLALAKIIKEKDDRIERLEKWYGKFKELQ